jgi:hypothetical protein
MLQYLLKGSDNAMKLEQPDRAKPIIEHLITWGEVAVCELSNFSDSEGWLRTLIDASIIQELRKSEDEVLSWALTSKGQMLIDCQLESAFKSAFFQISDYRSYLIGILGEGLALAARSGMRDKIEEWTGNELVMILKEINIALDVIESKDRLVDQRPEAITKMCGGLPGRDKNWETWDQTLLGRCGRSQDLFDFALKRFAPLGTINSNFDDHKLPTILRYLPVCEENGLVTTQIRPEAWNIQRKRVQSSLALFDPKGNALKSFKNTQSTVKAIQDALIEQPFYRTVVNLAISAWRSPATNISTVELYLRPDEELSKVSILFGGQETGYLKDLLGRLLRIQGFRPYGHTDGCIPDELMDNLLRNLISLNILRLMDDEIQLHPEFQASLMAKRLRSVFRPGKQIQHAMVEELEQIMHNKSENIGDSDGY